MVHAILDSCQKGGWLQYLGRGTRGRALRKGTILTNLPTGAPMKKKVKVKVFPEDGGL